MRPIAWLACCSLLIPAFAFAQATYQPMPAVKAPASPGGGGVQQTGQVVPVSAAKPLPPDEATLLHLEGWEGAMKKVDTFYAAATKSSKDTLKKIDKVSDATMWIMKPNYVRFDLTAPPLKQGDARALELSSVSNGKTLYMYDVKDRTRTAVNLGTSGTGNMLLLEFLVGMSVKQVTDRFNVKTIQSDEDFVYLQMDAVKAEDKEVFNTAVLCLCGAKFKERAYVPRRIALDYAQQKDTWDFPDPKVNPKGIELKTFDLPPLPKGWKEETVDLKKPSGNLLERKLPETKK